MREHIWERVSNIQSDFVYSRLHNPNNSSVQAWRCGRADSGHYAFEIIISQSGIYLNGDIGPLSWRVSRNIGFLAGSDIDYYIHSKLEHDFLNQTELSEDKRDQYICSRMADELEQTYEEYRFHDNVENMVRKDMGVTIEEVNANEELHDKFDDAVAEKYDEVADACNRAQNMNLTLEQMVDLYHEIGFDNHEHKGWEIYSELNEISDLQELYEAIGRVDKDFDYDWSFTETSESIIFRLYMACYAARKIQEQEKRECSTQVALSL